MVGGVGATCILEAFVPAVLEALAPPALLGALPPPPLLEALVPPASSGALVPPAAQREPADHRDRVDASRKHGEPHLMSVA